MSLDPQLRQQQHFYGCQKLAVSEAETALQNRDLDRFQAIVAKISSDSTVRGITSWVSTMSDGFEIFLEKLKKLSPDIGGVILGSAGMVFGGIALISALVANATLAAAIVATALLLAGMFLAATSAATLQQKLKGTSFWSLAPLP